MKITLPDGRQVDAELVSVTSSNEQWSEYLLSNGDVLKTKTVLIEVWRIVGEFAPNGQPLYQANTYPPIISVSSPERRAQ